MVGQRRPGAGRGDQVQRLGQQRGVPHAVLRAAGVVRVLEDHSHIHLAGPQHAQRLGRFGLDEAELDLRVAGGERGRRPGYHGRQRRREGGQPHPPGPQPAVRGQFHDPFAVRIEPRRRSHSQWRREKSE